MTESQQAFLLADYSERHQQFYSHVGQVVTDQRQALIFVGAFWTWLASNDLGVARAFVVWVPTAFIACMLVKWCVLRVTLRRLINYVKAVESQFDLPDGLGWATNYKQYGKDLLSPFTTGYWVVLLLVNIAAAFLMPSG